jgi:hypothetical protein
MGIRKLIAGYGKEIVIIIGLIAVIISGCSNLATQKEKAKMKSVTMLGEEFYQDEVIVDGKKYTPLIQRYRLREDEETILKKAKIASEYYTKEEIEFYQQTTRILQLSTK